MEIILIIFFGAVVGWIAGIITKSVHRSIAEDVVLGIIGAFIVGYVMRLFGQSGITGLNFYSLIIAIIGAVVVIGLARIIRK